MRTKKQGDFTLAQTKMLRRLYPQFETALRRLHLLERERAARGALESFLSRLPLPTMLLRWNLGLVYQNKAAREFCSLWAVGPELATLTKVVGPVPAEILDRCRQFQERWRETSRLSSPRELMWQEIIHHSKWSFLRATVSMRQLSMGGMARPHFLIECEELCRPARSISHMVRLTQREQQLTGLVCDGRSNQEIADGAGLSVAMVKKHLHSIFHKLEVPSRSRLIALMR
jgi:DNA-binding CsgD family transcriptional regulator